MQQCGDKKELGGQWFRHTIPFLVEVTGHRFRVWFEYTVDFSFMCMEGAVRCFNEKDRVMSWNQPVWRLLVSLQVWVRALVNRSRSACCPMVQKQEIIY